MRNDFQSRVVERPCVTHDHGIAKSKKSKAPFVMLCPLDEEVRYSFEVEWADPITEVKWRYQLNLYDDSGEIEMVDNAFRSS